MFEVFNMGLGFCYVVEPADAERTLVILKQHGRVAQRIGTAVFDPQKIVCTLARGLRGSTSDFGGRGGAARRVG
jgi:phosphoribosylaminoimidazole (AIR) synthetase